jgi:hypothetical protein
MPKSSDDPPHALKIAQSFLAHVGYQPEIRCQRSTTLLQCPYQPKQSRYAERVVSDARATDAPGSPRNFERDVCAEYCIKMGGHDQGVPGTPAWVAGVDIVKRVRFHVLQLLRGEEALNKIRALALLESGRWNTLDLHRQIEDSLLHRGSSGWQGVRRHG